MPKPRSDLTCIATIKGVATRLVPERPDTFAMGVAARNADVLELLVGHLQERKASATAFQHSVDLPGDGTKHEYDPVNEPAAPRRAAVQLGAAITECINCIHLAINQFYQLYSSYPRSHID